MTPSDPPAGAGNYNAGMRAQFQFTLSRSFMATTLIVLGIAQWPIFWRLENEFLGIVSGLLFFALPCAGLGVLFDRGWAGFMIGATIGFAVLLLVPAIDTT
jgi:hypothetical protein